MAKRRSNPDEALDPSAGSKGSSRADPPIRQGSTGQSGQELRRTQAELEASRARYFDLYDLAPVGYFALSEEGMILEGNLTAVSMLGVARSALVEQPLTRFILPEGQDSFRRHRQELFKTGTPQACELRMLRAGGAPFWARLEATATQGAGGVPICWAVMSDISERKLAEEALHRSEERYRRLVESGGDMVFSLDRAGVFHTAGGARLQAFGLTPKDLVGRSLYDIFPEEEARRYQQKQLQVFEGGAGITYESTFEFAGQTKTDLTTTYPIADGSGEVELVGVVCRDITERKRTEEELKKSERTLRLIAENATDVIFAYDMDRRLIYVNPALEAFTGYTVAELREKNFINWLHPEDEAKLMALWEDLFVGKYFSGEEFRIVTKDGQVKWCLSSWGPLYDESGGQIGVQGRERDITERQQAVGKINQQLKELRQWHEATLGREDRVRQLKCEVNELRRRLGEPPRYPSQEAGSGAPPTAPKP